MAAVAGGYRVPVRIDFTASPPAVRWQAADGSRFTEPFLDDALARFRRAAGGRDPLPATPLDSWSGPAPARGPDAIVLHVSRCGSTLLSQMLAALPDHLVVSEARVFDDLLRTRASGVDDAARESWLRHAAAAFAASQAVAPRRLVIKLDCWHVFEIARVRRAWPGVPLLFVYRDPLEVLVSLMRRPSLTLVRGTVTPEEIGITRGECDALSQVEHAAAILGAFFREAAEHREHLVPVAYTSLPDAAWEAFPGAPFTPEDTRALRRVSEADAKSPRRPFVPDSVTKRAEATDAVRAACARWAAPAYEAWLASI